MAESPYSRRNPEVLVFSFPSRWEAIFTFLRPFLFNILVVSLNSNVMFAVFMLGTIELIRAALLTMKGCRESRINFYERVRLFAGLFEAFCYLLFYFMTLYCYFQEDDSSIEEAVPYNVQLLSILALVFILACAFIQMILSIIVFVVRLTNKRQLIGGHFYKEGHTSTANSKAGLFNKVKAGKTVDKGSEGSTENNQRTFVQNSNINGQNFGSQPSSQSEIKGPHQV